MTVWSIDPISGSTLALLVAGALFLIGPGFGRATTTQRWILTGLRAIALAILALMLLRPTLVSTTAEKRGSVLQILFDISASMSLAQGDGDQTRWQAQKQALEELATSLPKLPPEIETQWIAFDQTLTPLDVPRGGKPKLPDSPVGVRTDIATSLDDAVRRNAGRRVLATILLSDGAQTAPSPETDSISAARRLRDEADAPLYAVGFGPRGTASQGKDVIVERLEDQFSVFVKNELAFSSWLRVAGYANQTIPVELTMTDAAGQSRVVQRVKVVAREDDAPVQAAFAFRPDTPGRFKLTVRAEAQPGELVSNNNSLDAFLTVLEGGLKVLLLDGGKRPEHKFIRRALGDSPDIELDEITIDVVDRRSWPRDLGKSLTDGKFDAFLLGNLPAAALGEKNLSDLATAVAKGKGLVMIGGVRSLGAGNYAESPLADVLPITFDRLERQGLDEPDREDLFLTGPLPMRPAGAHPVVRLFPDNENLTAWASLPPLDFANRFTGVKTAPGVRTLLVGPRDEPLLVSGEHGDGRVLAFAGESTWRWPLKGRGLEHKRFWRQIVLWLTRREDLQRSDVWIKLEQRRLGPGGILRFTIGAKSPEGDSVQDAVVKATLVAPDGTRSELRTTNTLGRWTGAQPVKAPGDYSIEVEASRGSEFLGKTKADFVVYERDVELSNPAADYDHLTRLADVTKAQGGRLAAPEELPAIIAELAQRPVGEEVKQKRWRLGDTGPDAWLILFALAIPLSVEWALRKKWGLV